MKIERMVIFNLATDENDPLLAFTSDWINAFSELVNVTEVVSTHVGNHSLPETIKVYEIGGGTIFRKSLAILKLIYHGMRIIANNRNTLIFHHMSTYSAFILGPLFRLRGFKQGLWYSHNRDSIILRVGSIVVNHIFSPTLDSFPFKSKKLHPVGHGISLKRFDHPEYENPNRNGIVSIGRVSEVKRLDKLISGLSESKVKDKSITLVGPILGQNNLYDSLVSLAKQNNLLLNFSPTVPYTEVAKTLSDYSMCYTGSPKTVDKSSIEGALMGCFVLSENVNVLEQTGMNEVWQAISREAPKTISEQIKILSFYESRIDLRKILSGSASEKNDLKSTTKRIFDQSSKHD